MGGQTGKPHRASRSGEDRSRVITGGLDTAWHTYVGGRERCEAEIRAAWVRLLRGGPSDRHSGTVRATGTGCITDRCPHAKTVHVAQLQELLLVAVGPMNRPGRTGVGILQVCARYHTGRRVSIRRRYGAAPLAGPMTLVAFKTGCRRRREGPQPAPKGLAGRDPNATASRGSRWLHRPAAPQPRGRNLLPVERRSPPASPCPAASRLFSASCAGSPCAPTNSVVGLDRTTFRRWTKTRGSLLLGARILSIYVSSTSSPTTTS